MEPDGLLKPSIWFVGEVPTQRLRGPVLVELETTDQSSRVGKSTIARSPRSHGTSLVDGRHKHLGSDRLAIIIFVVDPFWKSDAFTIHIMERHLCEKVMDTV